LLPPALLAVHSWDFESGGRVWLATECFCPGSVGAFSIASAVGRSLVPIVEVSD
jgi:hypothetical protein